METNPLQQLRDIHLPAEPSWWPPAAGWWVLAIAAAALLIWGVRRALNAYRQRAPLRAAMALLERLRADYDAGTLSAEEYLQQGNAVLKRLLVRALGQRQYAELSGSAWLHALNDITASTVFTESPSCVLGDARFSRAPQIDVELLDQHLRLVVARVRP